MSKLASVIGQSILLSGMAVGLAAQAAAQQTSATDQAVRKQIEALATKYEAAFNGKNAAGVAALFANDGVLMVPGAVVSGRQAIEKFYEGAFKNGFSDLHGQVEEAHAVGDIAWARGSFTEMRPAIMQQGATPEHVRGVYGAVYERQGGDYKIVQLTGMIQPNAAAQPSVSTTPPASPGTTSSK